MRKDRFDIIGKFFREIDKDRDQAVVDLFNGEFDYKDPKKQDSVEIILNSLKMTAREIKMVLTGQDDHLG